MQRLLELREARDDRVALSREEVERLERILADRESTAADVEDEAGVAARERERIRARAAEAESLARGAREGLQEALEEKKRMDARVDAARAAADGVEAADTETEEAFAEVSPAAPRKARQARKARKARKRGQRADDSLSSDERAVVEAAASLRLELDDVDSSESASGVLEEWRDDYEEHFARDAETRRRSRATKRSKKGSEKSRRRSGSGSPDAGDDEWGVEDFDPSSASEGNDSKAKTSGERVVLAALGFRDVAEFAFGDMERNALADVLSAYFEAEVPGACPAARGRVVVGVARAAAAGPDEGSSPESSVKSSYQPRRHGKFSASRKTSLDSAVNTSDIAVEISCDATTKRGGTTSRFSKAEKSDAAGSAREGLAAGVRTGELLRRMTDAGFRVKRAYVSFE